MILLDAIRNAKRVYLIGNGGSYSNAAHVANDLLACGVRAFTLDPATLTASANDFGYETVFARWISVVGEEGDLLVAFSGSGKSPNILNAIETAESIGMKVIKIFGSMLGQDMQAAEEHQLNLGHHVMLQLKKERQ